MQRLISFCSQLFSMKRRLTITVDTNVLDKARIFAAQHQTSLSELNTLYLERVTGEPFSDNVITLVKSSEKPKMDVDKDLKSAYYEQQKEKYGF